MPKICGSCEAVVSPVTPSYNTPCFYSSASLYSQSLSISFKTESFPNLILQIAIKKRKVLYHINDNPLKF